MHPRSSNTRYSRVFYFTAFYFSSRFYGLTWLSWAVFLPNMLSSGTLVHWAGMSKMASHMASRWCCLPPGAQVGHHLVHFCPPMWLEHLTAWQPVSKREKAAAACSLEACVQKL